MPREIYANRVIPVNYDDDIQHIIDERPSTAEVYQTPHNTVLGEPVPILAASFQCRIDLQRPRPHGGDVVTTLGKAYDTDYVLLARAGQDKDGNTVALEHGDDILVDGVRYRCMVVTTFTEKVEAILEHVE